jgi:ribosomal protein S21
VLNQKLIQRTELLNHSTECCVGLKKRVTKKGIVQECRDRKYYTKPNDLKNQNNQALKRKKKLDAKRKESSQYRRVR